MYFPGYNIGHQLLLKTCILSICIATHMNANAETLYSAVQKAINSHPTVMISHATHQAAIEAANDAKSLYKPSITMRMTGGYEQSDNETTRNRVKLPTEPGYLKLDRNEASVTLSQLLFDGYSTRNRLKAAIARKNSSKYDLMDSSQRIGLQAVEAYLELVRQKKRVAHARKNVGQHEKMLELTRIKTRSGAGTSADIQQAKARLDLAKSTLLDFEGSLRNGEARYIEVFGELTKENMSVPKKPSKAIPLNLEFALITGVNSSPSYQSVNENWSASRYDVNVNRGSYYPSVSMEITSSRNENLGGLKGSGNSGLAQIVLNYNLYDGGSRSALKRQSYARMYESQFRREEIKRQLEEEIRITYNAYLTAGVRLPVLKSSYETSSKVLNAYKSQFELGKRTLLNLLDAQTELFQSHVAYNDGQFAYLFSHYQLLAATGKLLDHLKVQVSSPGDFTKPKTSFKLNQPFPENASISNNSPPQAQKSTPTVMINSPVVSPASMTAANYAPINTMTTTTAPSEILIKRNKPRAIPKLLSKPLSEEKDFVQVATFDSFNRAKQLKNRLIKRKINDVHIVGSSTEKGYIYTVQIGPVNNDDNFNNIKKQLEKIGYKETSWVKR